MSVPDEQALIELALRKDVPSLEKLLFLRYDWLVAEARNKIPRDLWGIIDPEDIVQDACIKVFTSFESFEPIGEGALFQWMRKITQNVAIDHLRKLSRNPRPLSDAGSNKLDSLLDDLQLLDLTVSTVMQKQELSRAFSIALEKLEPDYRRCIELLYLESKSLSEAARIMGKPESAVRGYRQRAREKLRESIIRLSFYV